MKGSAKRDPVSVLKRTRERARTHLTRKRWHKLHNSKTPVAFDGCPVPPILHAVLKDCRNSGIAFSIISADRRDGIAQRFGHASQKELYDKWRAGVPGYLPANPPGHSTHEYRDGPGSYPYGTPDGSTLREPWKLGLDFGSNAQASNFVAKSKKLGYDAWQPYNTTSELHHVDFHSNPLPNLRKRGKAKGGS